VKNDESQERLGYTNMSTAEEMQHKLRRYEYKTILDLCEEWSVSKAIFTQNGEDLPAIYRFEDGSTLNIGTMTASWWRIPNDEQRAKIRRDVEEGFIQ